MWIRDRTKLDQGCIGSRFLNREIFLAQTECCTGISACSIGLTLITHDSAPVYQRQTHCVISKCVSVSLRECRQPYLWCSLESNLHCYIDLVLPMIPVPILQSGEISQRRLHSLKSKCTICWTMLYQDCTIGLCLSNSSFPTIWWAVTCHGVFTFQRLAMAINTTCCASYPSSIALRDNEVPILTKFLKHVNVMPVRWLV